MQKLGEFNSQVSQKSHFQHYSPIF